MSICQFVELLPETFSVRKLVEELNLNCGIYIIWAFIFLKGMSLSQPRAKSVNVGVVVSLAAGAGAMDPLGRCAPLVDTGPKLGSRGYNMVADDESERNNRREK